MTPCTKHNFMQSPVDSSRRVCCECGFVEPRKGDTMSPAKHQPPPCRACGKPWAEHPPIEELCRQVQELRAEVRRLRSERAASIATIGRAVDHAEALLGIQK